MKQELEKAYEPQKYEDDIYATWEESGFFNPDNLKAKGKPFVISMPPPNATGILHLGHASALAYEDLMIRYHRLKGRKALWVPGTDHAAIATQTKVEKILAKEGSSREELGREKFLARVRDYVAGSQDTIRNQTRKMGSSCDWSRERYTFDKGLSQAVSEAFVRMYNDGLIERDYRIVNWCPRCASTLADDEVEYEEQDAKLYYIKYGPFTIATTRPETKLADTGVAVHPSDKKYKKYIGQTLDIDLAGHNIKVKVFSDKAVDPKFGSGAVGVTPAHSAVDFEFAQKNGLEIIKLIGEDGKLLSSGGKYKGMDTLSARKVFVKDLEAADQIVKVEDYKNNLSICYRCDTPIEPLTSEQWFVRVNKKIPGRNKTLKQLATQTVKSGEIKILPDRFAKTYYHWMDNLHDWCISRQIWWGHRIPVWYKKSDTDIKLTLFRHTQSEANALKVGAGHKDYKLTEKGVEQAKKIAGEINPDDFDIIFSSDLSRAKQTAEILFPGKKIISDKRLREVDFGDMTDKSSLMINKYRAKGFPNGETYQDVRDRVQLFLDDISSKYKNKKIAVVSHSGVWKVFEIIFNGADFTEEFLSTHAALGAKEYDLDKKSEEIYVGHDKPKGKGWIQDEDTLDTWFSSALWTFSTLGWPIKNKIGFNKSLVEKVKNGEKTITHRLSEKELSVGETCIVENTQTKKSFGFIRITEVKKIKMKDLDLSEPGQGEYKSIEEFRKRIAKYYPDMDVTINSDLWVYRYIYSKKSDLDTFHPTTVMETGYDIIFFWVARMILMTEYLLDQKPFETVYLHGMIRDKAGKKMSKSLGNGIDPIEMSQKFGTDALRLSLIIGSAPGSDLKLYEEKIAGYRNFVNKLWNISRFIFSSVDKPKSIKTEPKAKTLADKWILSEFNNLAKEVDVDLAEFRFSAAGEKLYDFTWNKLADWYLEISKIEKNKDQILLYILERLLILWHPFTPFVTELLWQQFDTKEMLMVKSWPKTGKVDKKSLENFSDLQKLVIKIRNLKAENKIPPKDLPNCYLESKIFSKEDLAVVAQLSRVTLVDSLPKAKSFTIGKTKGKINLVKELSDKERSDLEKYIKATEAKLNNKNFTDNAPPQVVADTKKRLTEAKNKLK